MILKPVMGLPGTAIVGFPIKYSSISSTRGEAGVTSKKGMAILNIQRAIRGAQVRRRLVDTRNTPGLNKPDLDAHGVTQSECPVDGITFWL